MKLTFKPKAITKSLLSVLHDRSRDIIERRFGIAEGAQERMTLEAIGEIYGITRERVRQIENASLASIRKSDQFTKTKSIFDSLDDALTAHGGLVREEDFLGEISGDKNIQNHVNFLLVLSGTVVKLKESDDFHHRLTLDPEFSDQVHGALGDLHTDLGEEDVVSEEDIISKFMEILRAELNRAIEEDHARKWLRVSKRIGSNPLGEWGLSHSPNIKARGMRDLAYLVLRKKGEPMHFSEVAEEISETFNKSAHVATTHNELIKDDRFVLVGRGLYALTEWGYASGVVRDVVKAILKKSGPMTKDEIIKEVMKQRQVKENTIYVNLQNGKYFKKSAQGKYSLV